MAPDSASGSASTKSSSSSSIRVFVRWHEQVVFAGEEVKCTITFKNVARAPDASGRSTPTALRPSTQYPPNASRHPAADRGPRQPPALHPGAQGRGKPNSGLAPPPSARGHRSTLSLSAPSSRARAGSGSSWTPGPPAGARGQPNGIGNGSASGSNSGGAGGGGHGHKRSVSIVSIGSLSAVDDGQSSTSSPKPPRPRGHARASSLQILPRGGPFNGPRSGQ
jgi:hypothetical protein